MQRTVLFFLGSGSIFAKRRFQFHWRLATSGSIAVGKQEASLGMGMQSKPSLASTGRRKRLSFNVGLRITPLNEFAQKPDVLNLVAENSFSADLESSPS
jgi:hypothetical protein